MLSGQKPKNDHKTYLPVPTEELFTIPGDDPNATTRSMIHAAA